MKAIFKGPVPRIALAIALAATFALSAIALFGATTYEIDGVSLRLSIRPKARGETVLSIPPFGEIVANTHVTPMRIDASLERIYPEKIGKVAQEAPIGEKLIARVERDARRTLRSFVFRLIAISALGGAVGAFFVKKRPHYALLGAAVGSIIIAALLGATYETYDLNAFRQPRYSGALSTAPWMTEAIAERLGALKTFREEIRDIAGNVHEFYSKVDSWEPVRNGEGDVRILQVSDIHTNPVALDIIERITRDFKAEFVIDTGDVTDFGTPLETAFIERIAKLNKPYLFVPGNHDSPATIERLKTLPNVTILDGQVKNLAGISVLGVADPASASGDTFTATKQALDDKARYLKRLATRERTFIVAAHNPAVARTAFKMVPVVLTGHTHQPDVLEDRGFVMINAGTTGAAGLRTFREEKGVPFSLQILRFKRNPLKLIAVDTVTVYGLEREFHFDRRVVDGVSTGSPALAAGSR
ncbi:MAG: metallophosphoesterase [Actinobacteria bacterium]|nr:metallophosphoesterase [Actinomycetota bacterium]